jgi:hypothetical protein
MDSSTLLGVSRPVLWGGSGASQMRFAGLAFDLKKRMAGQLRTWFEEQER